MVRFVKRKQLPGDRRGRRPSPAPVFDKNGDDDPGLNARREPGEPRVGFRGFGPGSDALGRFPADRLGRAGLSAGGEALDASITCSKTSGRMFGAESRGGSSEAPRTR